jgi:hypothetical protein
MLLVRLVLVGLLGMHQLRRQVTVRVTLFQPLRPVALTKMRRFLRSEPCGRAVA